jgi:predicted small lipoprotein YifL
MRSFVFIVLVLALAAACGIKAPPKPPLEATAPQSTDAGCCGARP